MGSLGNPGPGFLPFWVGVALATMSLTLIVGSLLDREKPGVQAAEGIQRQHVAWMVGGLLLYTLLLETVGYPVTTFLLLSALVKILGQRGWYTVLGFSALATAGSYALFGLWLGVPLPWGIFLR